MVRSILKVSGTLASMANTLDRADHTVHIYSDPSEDLEDDLLPEYDFSKNKPNPYAERARKLRAEAREPEAEETENQSSSEG